MNKRAQRKKFNTKLENFMSQIRFLHILNNMNPNEVYNSEDPIFPGYYPIDENGR